MTLGRLARFVALTLAVSPAGLLAQQSTRSVTDRYIELTFSQQYDALLDLYAADASFHDPTGDVFRGPVAEGPVQGADAIVSMQKGWGLAETVFDVQASFTVGEYSLYRGTLNTRYEGADSWTAIPFVTVLRVVEGRILERTDFGEYVESFALGSGFQANTDATNKIASQYLRAYLDGDVNTQAALASVDIIFQDPTSRVYGPPSGELYQGLDVLIARRNQIYESVSDFDFEVAESFVANHHAVFMGTTTYTLRAGQRFAQPAVFVVEVRDGKVTRHWDFVDYTVGPIG
jgi:ketosteroid isomerase-like protein